jgi:DNA-directed RNA polymerase II subunit RPB2
MSKYELPSYIPIEDITPADMLTLVHSEVKRKGIAGHHIESMNSFYNEGIEQIATKVFSVDGRVKPNRDDKDPADRDIAEISFHVDFTSTRLTKPVATKYNSGRTESLTPNLARLKSLTYSAQLFIDATATATAYYKNGETKTITDTIKDLRIAPIPCMVGSDLCITHNISREMKKNYEEDPNDHGGYFIIQGGEWVIDNLENLNHNIFHVYKQKYENEVVRGMFISKPGDAFENSFQIILRYLQTGAITLEMTIANKEVMIIPFYIIFRLFGMTSDREIVNHVVYGVDNEDPITRSMMRILERCFEVEDSRFNAIQRNTNPDEILRFLANKFLEVKNEVAARKDDNVAKYQNNKLLAIFDKNLFPHIGMDPAHRIKKLRFFGHLVSKLLLVHLNIVEPTDRDSYKSKRVHSAGTSMAKTFKTHFNIAFVQPIKKSLYQDFMSTPFSQVQMAKSIMQVTRSEALEKPLTQSIVSGTRTITHKKIVVRNRVSSQSLYRKNDMNVISTLNNINTPDTNIGSKNTDRADEMRRVHPTYTGYIDVSQSADTGEPVGMKKQLACTASVCSASSSFNLKKSVLGHPDMIPLDKVQPEDMNRDKLSKVFVGGDWIGCCKSAHDLTHYFRMARRYGDINPYVTIVWEPLVREVYFWTDVGRLMRPLVIVYNNLPEYIEQVRGGNRDFKFQQWVLLKREHIAGLRSGALTMDSLREQRIIEYISPEEQESTYISPNIGILRDSQNDIRRKYTHCDIDQAIFGLVTLAAPLANHSNSVRNTMYTNHRKQSCGWYCLNFPYRIDKGRTLQWYCEKPIVSAFSSALTYPNGHNCMVALILHGGSNQEDSIHANQSSIDCGMFNASHYNYEKRELEKGEKLGNPDRARTVDIKRDATYANIDNGLIAEGSLVTKGSVLISKYMPIQNPVDQRIYTDKSVVYKKDEPVRVERAIVVRNNNDVETIKVKWRANRPLSIGDKLSSETGNKGICAALCPRNDMPYCLDGIVPDLLVNAHSIPTRMAVNQILSTVLGTAGARAGIRIDATALRDDIDIDTAIKILEDHGIKYAGHRPMYNGMTGCWINTMIFVGITVYQRLEKFVVDEHYATRSGPTSALTRQPLDGKNKDGGLRMGEMEGWVLYAHGAMRFMHDKYYKDSDGIKLPICRVCGNRAVVNEEDGIYKCKTCADAADIVSVSSSWVANLLANELTAMNAKISYVLEPFTYPVAEGGGAEGGDAISGGNEGGSAEGGSAEGGVATDIIADTTVESCDFKAGDTPNTSKISDMSFSGSVFRDVGGRLKYTPGNVRKDRIHYGQRKLLMCEISFLTNTDSEWCIYAGSAPNVKGAFLASLFPKRKFVFIDPNPFHIKPYPNIVVQEIQSIGEIHDSDANIYTLRDYMTVEIARELQSLDCVFISDIRTNMEKDTPTDTDVLINNIQQYSWCIVLGAKLSMLKFRHPFHNEGESLVRNEMLERELQIAADIESEYTLPHVDFIGDYEDKRLHYFSGSIMIQPWSGAQSAETRLITDCKNICDHGLSSDYEERLYYYNKEERIVKTGPVRCKTLGYCGCMDCRIEYDILQNYVEKFITQKKTAAKKICELIKQVSEYVGRLHRQDAEKKYQP